MKVKVLYVEDESALAMIVSDSLRSFGFEVIHRENGFDALSAFKAYEPDVVVLDIMMPKMDGFTLAKEIRDINKETPLIFLSALTNTQDVVKGFKLGGDDYIRKPFKIEELIVRIEAQANRKLSKPPVQEKFTIGGFELNTSKSTLSDRRGQEVDLTYREMELLRVLLENEGQVVKRGTIASLIDPEGDGKIFTGRSLDVFISRLRKYFSTDSRIKIVNVRGVGYMLSFDK